MDEVRGGGSRSSAAEELILRTVAAHADSLLRTARKYSLCPDDAQDAYQRALEIFMTNAERLDPTRAPGWLHVVVKHEAQAIRRSRRRLVNASEIDLDGFSSGRVASSEEQLLSFDLVSRSAEALQRLKPQELRALWLKAQGHSYNEIGALTGWSYTKVNRCLTEGRRSFLERYAGIESGDECARWAPVLSAMVDGEATSEQLLDLRPHLRNCPGCRATLKALHESSPPLSAVLPIPLAVGVASGGTEHISNLFMRAYEAIAGGVHERAVHSVTKAQAAIEAAAAGKVAAVAASAAAVAGGGYATVERTVRHEPAPRAAKAAQHEVARTPKAVVAGARVVPAAAQAVRPVVTKPAVDEFGRSTGSASGAGRTEFGASRRRPSVRTISTPASSQHRSSAAAKRVAGSAPEFATPRSGNEFGP